MPGTVLLFVCCAVLVCGLSVCCAVSVAMTTATITWGSVSRDRVLVAVSTSARARVGARVSRDRLDSETVRLRSGREAQTELLAFPLFPI